MALLLFPIMPDNIRILASKGSSNHLPDNDQSYFYLIFIYYRSQEKYGKIFLSDLPINVLVLFL